MCQNKGGLYLFCLISGFSLTLLCTHVYAEEAAVPAGISSPTAAGASPSTAAPSTSISTSTIKTDTANSDSNTITINCPTFENLKYDTYMRQFGSISVNHQRWKVQLSGSVRPIHISKESKPTYHAAAIQHSSKMPFCLGTISEEVMKKDGLKKNKKTYERKFSVTLKTYTRHPPECTKDPDEMTKFTCEVDDNYKKFMSYE